MIRTPPISGSGVAVAAFGTVIVAATQIEHRWAQVVIGLVLVWACTAAVFIAVRRRPRSTFQVRLNRQTRMIEENERALRRVEARAAELDVSIAALALAVNALRAEKTA